MIKEKLRTRRLAWEIIKKATRRNRRLSDVTAEIFRREGDDINDQDRRFVTMLVVFNSSWIVENACDPS